MVFGSYRMRSILSSQSTQRQQLRQLGLITLLLLIFGTELVSGISLIADPRRGTPLQVIGYAWSHR